MLLAAALSGVDRLVDWRGATLHLVFGVSRFGKVLKNIRLLELQQLAGASGVTEGHLHRMLSFSMHGHLQLPLIDLVETLHIPELVDHDEVLLAELAPGFLQILDLLPKFIYLLIVGFVQFEDLVRQVDPFHLLIVHEALYLGLAILLLFEGTLGFIIEYFQLLGDVGLLIGPEGIGVGILILADLDLVVYFQQ